MTPQEAITALGGKERAAAAISAAHPTRTISRWGVLRWQQSGKIPHWWDKAVDTALKNPHGAKTPPKKEIIMYQDYTTKDLVARRDELADQIKVFAKAVDQLGDELIRRAGVDPEAIGTHNAEVDGFKVKVSVGKSVKWDEDELQAIWNRIANDDGDPADFIDNKLSVSETKYNAWPASWQDLFRPARTVKPSKPRVEVRS